MQRILLSILTLFLMAVAYGQHTVSLIPAPVELKQYPGSLLLKNTVTVSNSFPSHDWPNLFKYFKKEMQSNYGITVIESARGKKADIDFFMTRMPTSGKPAYKINVSSEGVRIQANFADPAFYAMQTFFQLLPTDPKAVKEIPFVEIFDHARFNYRGMHLDVSRHFWSVDFIKRYIDYLAYHKLNVFHWHLTDDQGWRIEIKKYPKLTSVGGYRNGTLVGRYPGSGNNEKPHSGFYTQSQISEVVQYAKDRFIEIIPEIDVPAHTSAAIAAYPWLSCFPGKPTEMPAGMMSKKSIVEQKSGRIKLVQETWGTFDDVLCAGNDSVFNFLNNIIDELLTLFPSKYIHMGGDECLKTHWKICPKCQARKAKENLKDEHELQSYFMQRVEKYINAKGKTMIGWDEILEGGLAPNAVVMSWQGIKGGIAAAKQKHFAIMSPGNPLYFDHTQSMNEDSITFGGYNPIEKVYAYDPIPQELSEEESKYIMGAQANLWVEYILNTKKIEYQLFPRLAALSEVLWSPKDKKNWNDFENRLLAQIKRYDLWKVNYSKEIFSLQQRVLQRQDFKGVDFILKSRQPNTWFLGEFMHKWSSGFNNLQNANARYKDSVSVHITETGQYVWFVMNDSSLQQSTKFNQVKAQYFHFNKATGKKITLSTPASDKYPSDGAFTLVNGVINKMGFLRSREFLGFNGTNCEAVIDLGEPTLISFVVVNALHSRGNWIWKPSKAEVYWSPDQITWHPLKSTENFEDKKDGSGKGMMTMSFKAIYAQYVKVIVHNYGTIPTGNAGAGSKPWLFVDEIEIEGPSSSDLGK